MRAPSSVLAVLGLWVSLAPAAAAEPVAPLDPPAGMDLLSGIVYADGSQLQVLELWRDKAPIPAPAGDATSPRDPMKILAQARLYEGTRLVLTESAMSAGRPAKSLWKGRASELKLPSGETWFDADVVRDEMTGAVWVVVLQGDPGSLELRVYPVPQEQPQSKFLIGLWSDEICDSRKMDVSADVAGLLMTLKATDDRCRQLGVRFDPKSGAWTQVSLKRIEPAKPKEAKPKEKNGER